MSTSQDLEQLYYKLSFINDALSSKNENLQKTTEDFKDVISLFISHTEELKGLSQKVQESIATNVPLAAKQMAKEGTFQIEENLKFSFEDVASKLFEASRETEQQLNGARKALSIRNWLIGIISLTASILTALSISYFYLQKIETLTTKQFIKTYKYGLFLKEIWPKLSEKDKQKLDHFLEEKL